MPGHTRSEDQQQTVLTDIEQSRRTGAPPLGHLVGLHRIATPGSAFTLAFDLSRPALAGGASILEVAMLADLALGGVLRNSVGLTVPMPTVSMTIQLHPGQMSSIVTAEAEVTALAQRTALSRGRLCTGDGAIVGDAQAVFALPALPYDGPGRSMPWDTWVQAQTDGVGLPEQAETEEGAWPGCERLPEQIAAHASDNPVHAWGTTHIREHMTQSGSGAAMTPTVQMANRLGHVQGGALLTAAVIAAEQNSDFTVDNLVTTTIEFLDAARLEAPVLAAVRVLRQSGRSLFVSIVLKQDDRTCCHISAVFRR
ncbi:PaaI family thioesterase [Streptomyces sp. NPDC058794]|uniref:PaaI family thioesterase n=1 Tax=Streptomyces TaxID=1883 RepID=UPI00369C6E69